MSHIDSSDPRPREERLEFNSFRLETGKPRYLEVPAACVQKLFWDVIEHRKSRRQFAEIDDSGMSTLLWYTAKTLSSCRSHSGTTWEHRATPSAGGIHPIELITQPFSNSEQQLFWYDPLAHALCKLNADPHACHSLRRLANTVLDTQCGTIVWLVANFNKTGAVYSNAQTLVWRDTGVLIGMLCLVAEALNVNCCALGITGDKALRNVLPLPKGVHGVGAVVIGGRPNEI